MRNRNPDLMILGLLLLAILSRVIPHPPNFAPITAVAIFGAATLSNRRIALLLPVLAMFIGDLILGAAVTYGWYSDWMAATSGVHRGSWVIYLTMLGIGALGLTLREDRRIMRVGLTTILGSVIFYTVTNFAVWAGGAMYPHTITGLISCYVMAIPFFQWTALGDLFYTSLLFTLGYLTLPVSVWAPRSRNVTA